MLSCMIDTMEDQDVATYEIPGAFLKTDYNKGYIHIKMEGEMVNIIKKKFTQPTTRNSSIYISAKKVHVCRIQEGFIRNSRGNTTIMYSPIA